MRRGRRRGRAGWSRDVGDHRRAIDIELEPGYDDHHHDLDDDDAYHDNIHDDRSVDNHDDDRSVHDITAADHDYLPDDHDDLAADHHHCPPDVAGATPTTPRHQNG